MIPFVILAIEDDDDREFMKAFFLQYERLMYSEIYKFTSEPVDVEDILQTVLVKLIEKVRLLRSMERNPRVNYLITTIKNTSISMVCRKRRIDSLDDIDWFDKNQAQAPDLVEDMVFRRESVSRMEEVWPLLDEKSRFLLSARYFLGMNQEEIAAELNIKPDSVRMEMSRARKKVRELLAERFAMTDIWS